MSQSPTIGRIVRYRDDGGTVHPAVVTAVHSETCVNFKVLEDGYSIPWLTSVEREDENAPGERNRWFWPPRAGGDPKPASDPKPKEPEPAAA